MRNGKEKKITDFARRVYDAVREIPRGKVATYAQIALMSGHRGAARAVGNALHVNPFFGSVPCHRVVNAGGGLAKNFGFGGANEQKRLLEAEGVAVSGDNTVDLYIYQYRG